MVGIWGSTAKSTEGLVVRPISADDAALQLAYAKLVIVVPGYGMAVAQAQHQVRELATLIEKQPKRNSKLAPIFIPSYSEIVSAVIISHANKK